jgi:YidC/Oxa1 family membrane protein insertase
LAEFKNPGQQGGQDNKSLVVMMLVMVAVFFGLQFYKTKTNPQTVSPNAAQTAPAQAGTTTPGPVVAPGVAAKGAATPAGATVSATPAVPVEQAAAETTTVVENELYRIVFSNRGAQVVSWQLKRRPDAPKSTYLDNDGKPLDLVNSQAAKLFGYPMTLYTYDGTTMTIASATRNNQQVTLTTVGNLTSDLTGRSITINGAGDKTFNGSYAVTQTGPSTLTYTDAGENATSAGGTFTTVNGATGAALGNAMFVASATGALTPPSSLTFKYSDGNLEVRKTFTFDASYVLHADVQVTRNGVPVRALLSWPGGIGDLDMAAQYAQAQLDTMRNGRDEHLAPKKISGGDTLNGPFDWAGVSDNFFGAVFIPDNPANASVVSLYGQMDVAKTARRTGFGSGSPVKGAVEVPILGAALGDVSGHTQTRIFVGPKAINVLKAIPATNPKITLEPLLEFGFWGLIGKYLFLSLQFIHTHVASNWGWSIVILTVIINIIMLPFRIKTMQNGLKMQRIQPQMDAIKERYKKYKATDPKRNEMNAEIMQLQKDNGVNMFGGCIPTLITLPLLYAFFTMLPRVVELRQAHWLWLPDLQSPDPYHILPITMVLSQFLVQFYTPSPGVDPQQQKMMAFMMPAISGYFTWYYGSGLALYWAVGNLISIAQQAVMNRTSLGREMREIAAKRARRKAGTPSTIAGRR